MPGRHIRTVVKEVEHLLELILELLYGGERSDDAMALAVAPQAPLFGGLERSVWVGVGEEEVELECVLVEAETEVGQGHQFVGGIGPPHIDLQGGGPDSILMVVEEVSEDIKDGAVIIDHLLQVPIVLGGLVDDVQEDPLHVIVPLLIRGLFGTDQDCAGLEGNGGILWPDQFGQSLDLLDRVLELLGPIPQDKALELFGPSPEVLERRGAD